MSGDGSVLLLETLARELRELAASSAEVAAFAPASDPAALDAYARGVDAGRNQLARHLLREAPEERAPASGFAASEPPEGAPLGGGRASVRWECPRCGLSGFGALSLNGTALRWLDAAWRAHLASCAAQSSPAQRGETNYNAGGAPCT